MTKKFLMRLMQTSLMCCLAVLFTACDDFFGNESNPTPAYLSMSDKPVTIKVGETFLRQATSTSTAVIEYSSSDTKVATVDNSGLVTGVADGEATITATATGYSSKTGTKIYLPDSKSYKVTVGGGSVVPPGPTPGPTALATPLTMEAITAGTIVVTSPQAGMQYTLNGGAKTAVSTTAIDVAIGDKVQFYGNGTSITSYDGTKIAGGTAEVKVYGNIMSLVDEAGFAANTTLTVENTFRALFIFNDKLTDASGLLLPAKTLANFCYSNMFQGCTSLTAAPALPAETLANYCYNSMFMSCTSLATAPALPAEKLANNCYESMFYGCKALTAAPELKAETLANSCYYQMFYGCSSLTTAPKLPAETLANSCYYQMFYLCSSLTTAPKLPAETLANYCYNYMFFGCGALTNAYVKAAYTTANGECSEMFSGCGESGAKLHTTTTNKDSWDGVMGSGNPWSNWTAANDWTD